MRIPLVSNLVLALGLLSVVPAHAAMSPHAPAPTLGDPLTRWTASYGPPLPGTNPRTPGWFPCGTHDGRWQVRVVSRADHVFVIKGAACGETPPSVVARTTQARQHMPLDAARLGTYTSDHRTIVMYYSASLARDKAFVADDFRDCATHRVRHGAFSLSLAGSSKTDWTLRLGTCA